jgi:X-X-X-Leu-X-X-Gly heptad repeat protein
MVANIAGGLIQNVAGQALRNLPLIGDTFQKIAGGIGQIFGGIGQVAGGIGQLGQLLAPRGMFPPLPLPGFPGFPGGRPFNPGIQFGPRWQNVNININVTINNLQNVLRPGSPLLNNLNQVMGKLNQVLDSLRGILDRLGQQPPGGRVVVEPPGGRVVVGGPGGGIEIPERPPSVGGPGVGGTLDRLFGEMGNIQDQIGKIDTSKPEGMAQLMKLQMRMQQLQQMIQMINEMQKAMHDMSMSIIRNIR